jgi:integrase
VRSTRMWVELPPALDEAIRASLPPREDRDPEAKLFGDSNSDALRTAIAKACKALGVPSFSPHDLRHRRVSRLHADGRSWAEIGEFVGTDLHLTSNTYTHVIVDGEVNYAALLARAA